jgi:large exoprotein involved in heme utilization and adhesion
LIIATPLENNDITANAFTGAGGAVEITAQTILGLTPRSRSQLQALLEPDDPLDPVRLATSDITAISQVNPTLNGQVILRTPEVDPAQGLVELPTDTIDASRLIAQGCGTNTALDPASNEFIVTGRGGLPANPIVAPLESIDPPVPGSLWIDSSRSTSSLSSQTSPLSPTPIAPTPLSPTPIAHSFPPEAQGWVVGAAGEVRLVAQAAEVQSRSIESSTHRCEKPK